MRSKNWTVRLRRFGSVGLSLALGVACCLQGSGAAASPQARLHLCCRPDNDLWRVLKANGMDCVRHDTPGEAIAAAGEGAGALILADGYPARTTDIPGAVFEEAARKKVWLYVEYPAALPGLTVGAPQDIKKERGVVTSDIFGAALPPLSIVAINGCRYVPLEASHPHIVLAKVAGVDAAVFGLKDTPSVPALFDHPRGGLLLATTKLSQFVTGRYMPAESWRVIWRTILGRLGMESGSLDWTPTVRPTYGPTEPLPADAESQALARSAKWIMQSRVLRHPQWPAAALERSLKYNTVRDIPEAAWPRGDGSLGVLEGFSSSILADGSQPMRYAVRNDCMTEVAMLMAFAAAGAGPPQYGKVAGELLDYDLLRSGLALGERADPKQAAYGLVGWSLDSPESYWGDDNARAILAMAASGALLKDSRWNGAIARCVLGNFRTTGVRGYREECITHGPLRQRGWESYWRAAPVKFSPHYESWLWACFCWAYDQTHFAPLLERSQAGARDLMAAYPQDWSWCLRSGSIERARALLPLAWLVRVDDTPEHRQWLRRVALDLVALQDASGAIREVIAEGTQGTLSNAEYDTRETSLIQTNGDPICDLLYTCNFALIGLHEAAAATGEPFYAQAEERLAGFLCRVQISSQAHPELDGAWYRGFDFRRWEYWASNADWEWGPWCTETGWTQPWIAGALALRQQKTSLWELLRQTRIKADFERLRPEMLPDRVLAGTAQKTRPPAPDQRVVSLTLIPPSPVTDQITLDVRGAVWNASGEARRFVVSFYLDREEAGQLLGRQTIEVPPASGRGVSARISLQKRAGEHRVVLVAMSGSETRRTSQPITILPSSCRSTRRLGGAWVDIYHHDEAEGKPFNADLAQMTEQQWRELVQAMHAVDQDILVITMMFQNAHATRQRIETEGYQGRAYYPSALFPGRMPIALADPLEAILSEADRLGMHVLPGVGCYVFFDYSPGALAWCKRVAQELWDRYGHHPSFYGWYVSAEKDGALGGPEERREIVEFFRQFTPFVRRLAPDKPVMLAPNCFHLRGAEETYKQLLPNLDIICPFGYHRMPAGDLKGEEAAALMQSLCDAAGAHLWMDLESFVFRNGSELHPRPIGGLISDFTRFPSFEKTLHYQFPGLMSAPTMSRRPGGDPSVRLYLDYRDYLRAESAGGSRTAIVQ